MQAGKNNHIYIVAAGFLLFLSEEIVKIYLAHVSELADVEDTEMKRLGELLFALPVAYVKLFESGIVHGPVDRIVTQTVGHPRTLGSNSRL